MVANSSVVIEFEKPRRQSAANIYGCVNQEQYKEGEEQLFDRRSLLYGRGILGILDRIPPLFKIITCVLLAIIGTVVFGIILVVERATERNEVVQVSDYLPLNFQVGELVHQLQLERGLSSSYIGSAGTDFQTRLAAQRNTTNTHIPLYIDMANTFMNANTFDIQINSELASTLNKLANLENIRARVSNLTISSLDMFSWYTSINLLLCDVPQSFTDSANLIPLKNPMIAYAQFVRMKEMVAQVRGIGAIGVNSHFFTVSTYNSFLAAYIRSGEMERLFLGTADSDTLLFYNQTVVNQPFSSITNSLINIILNSDGNASTIDPHKWFDNMTLRIEALKSVEDFFIAKVQQLSQTIYTNTVIALTLYSAVFLALLVVAITTSVILSRSIIGPWHRMDQVQNETMRRYVPAGFLKLMGRRNLSDVQLGDYIVRSLDVFFADIRYVMLYDFC
jgi:methyl-accepting chemotaxis protein